MNDLLVEVLHRVVVGNGKEIVGLALGPDNRAGRNVTAVGNRYTHEDNPRLKNAPLPDKRFEDQGLHADKGVIHDRRPFFRAEISHDIFFDHSVSSLRKFHQKETAVLPKPARPGKSITHPPSA
jgi:hypothetical protein